MINARTVPIPYLALLLFSTQPVLAQGWSRLVTTGDPPPRTNASAVYDPAAHRMIVFGGNGESGFLNDLWSLNLATLAWEPITPTNQVIPPPRFTQNAVHDSARNRMIIWSGQGTGFYNDVWAFDFATSTWEQLWANGNVPNAPNTRYGTAATFDPVGRRLINASGFTVQGRFQDTWAFQVDSLQWADQTMSPHPVKRCLHAGCFAQDRNMMILYGGQTDGIPFLDDIWVLDAETYRWTDMTPVTARPHGRIFPSVVYSGAGSVLMFGGQTAQGISSELWQFSLDTNSWGILSAAEQQPAARYGHVAVFVPSTRQMVVFGGSGTFLLNDTWAYTATATSAEPPSATPSAFELHQNYPNPFNPATVIRYSLPVTGHVTLKIFNLLGQEVATLLDEMQNAGLRSARFDATDLPSGVYVYQLTAEKFRDAKRMLLIR
jgi:hypothetical protein